MNQDNIEKEKFILLDLKKYLGYRNDCIHHPEYYSYSFKRNIRYLILKLIKELRNERHYNQAHKLIWGTLYGKYGSQK